MLSQTVKENKAGIQSELIKKSIFGKKRGSDPDRRFRSCASPYSHKGEECQKKEDSYGYRSFSRLIQGNGFGKYFIHSSIKENTEKKKQEQISPISDVGKN
jgi:hypothetical protein